MRKVQLAERGHSPDKSVSSGDTGDGIEHDFGALAAKEGTDEPWLPVVPKTKDWIAEDSNKIRV
jgi:hypothetical protein